MKKIWQLFINIFHTILTKIFVLLKKDLSEETFSKIIQFIKFGIIGFSNNIIFFIFNIITLLLLKKFMLQWDYIVANIVAFTASVIWSFFWNNKYVFKLQENEERSLLKTFIKTYIAYAFSGIILNNVLSYLWITLLNVSKYIVPLFNIAITLPINFIANKFWAYNKKIIKPRNKMIHPLSDVKSKSIGDNTNIWQFCVVFPEAKIGDNCNICASVLVENDVSIGNNVTVKSGVQLWDGVTIEDNVFIGPNVTFTNDIFPRSKIYPKKFEKTLIKKGASIGANTTIVAGNTIGENAMVGAGSVVTHDIPANEVWFGNPAKFVRKID